MAAPAKNSLSVGHLTQNEKNTFTKQDVKRRRAMHLQLYLQELKERERRAQEHNSQLLQQFEEAQDSLKEMLARTAAMKTIRMEYERYLEDNSSRWQHQLREQTQAAQTKRTEDCLKAYLKRTEENQVLVSTGDRPLLSQGPSNQTSVPPQVCSTQAKSDYHKDNSFNHPFAQSSWLTSSFLTASNQSYNPSLPHPPTFLHPHSFLPQNFPSTHGHHQPWSRQDDADGDPGPCAAGTTPEEPPASRVPTTGEEHEETSRVQSSNRAHDGGSRRCLSPDLDIKPVRLFSGHTESSESDRDSSLVSREKTKKRRTQRSESHISQKTPNKMDTASFLPQSSESDTSSEESSTIPVGSLQSEDEAERDEEEESHHTDEEEDSSDEESQCEKEEGRNPADESESCGAEQESGRSNTTRAEDETDDQEQSIKEEDGDRQKNPGPGEETETSQSEEQGSDEEEDDDEDVCITGKTEEEAEVRMEDQGEDERQKQVFAFSQDGSENSEDEEGSHDEDQGEESGDSEDVIISPQNKRPEQIQIISEAEENKTQSSEEVSDEDIENLLAPQEQTEEKELKANEEPKEIYHNMNIFQVAKEKSKTVNKSDSDEFDNFYD